jgi:GT2 family glycosyltransferase
MEAPELSVIVPAYDSQETIGGCLERLERQTFRSFEVVVVDSGPDDTTEAIVRGRFPWVIYRRIGHRLFPHAARNLGVGLARGRLLVFTDPDTYARADWLERLVAAHRETGGVVVGALACFGGHWLDQGVHLCKFSKWLPGGEPRPVDMSPTANMLIPRALFEEAGGFPGEELLGDVILSRSLRERGHGLRLAPDAVVEHHHLHTVRSFLRERFTRGTMYGEMRSSWHEGRGPALFHLLILPIRLPRILALVAGHAWRTGHAGRYFSTFPLVLAGHAASLAGEAVAYVRRIGAPRKGDAGETTWR